MDNKITDDLGPEVLTEGLINFSTLALGLSIDITPQNIPDIN